MTQEQLENLLKEVDKLHQRQLLSTTVGPDYFEPGMMEYLDQSDGFYDADKGILKLRFESRGTRYEGRTERIEKVKVGDPIEIVREETNAFNHNNFLLYTEKGFDIGNMPAELCNVIAPLYDEGILKFLDASVSFVEPISKRNRHAKQAIVFIELCASIIDNREVVSIMTNEHYCIQVMIVANGNIQKGTLILSPDHYEFNGIRNHIDWARASFTRGKTKFKTPFSESEFSYLKIEESDHSLVFIMESSQLDAVVAKIIEFGAISKPSDVSIDLMQNQKEDNIDKTMETVPISSDATEPSSKPIELSSNDGDDGAVSIGSEKVDLVVSESSSTKIEDQERSESRVALAKEKVDPIINALKSRYPEGSILPKSFEELKFQNADLPLSTLSKWTEIAYSVKARDYLIEQGLLPGTISSKPVLSHNSEDGPIEQTASEIASTVPSGVLYRPGEEPVRIKNRMERLFEKLDSAYPDKIIISLDKTHKHWGETATELYRQLGYPDRNSFLNAYGYKTEMGSTGRPSSDPMEVVNELKRRYANGATCAKMVDLAAENPDLAPKFKNLSNQADKFFGMTLVKYFIQEGILIGKTDDQCSDEFEVLKSRYASEPFAGTLYELREANADIDWGAIRQYYTQSGSHDTMTAFLIERGILSSDEEKLAAIEKALLERYKGKEKLPDNVTQIKQENKELKLSAIDALVNKVKGVSAKEYFTTLGILPVEKTPEEKISEIVTILKKRYTALGKKEDGFAELTANNPDLDFSSIIRPVRTVYSMSLPNYLTSQGFIVDKEAERLQAEKEGFIVRDKILHRYTGDKADIVLPNSIMSIEKGAFSGCRSLTSIVIPDSVTFIEDYAFWGCSYLKSVRLPNSVTNIGDRTFSGCSSLVDLVIPESVTNIGQMAFFGCNSLTSITIPDSVTDIGEMAFAECKSLTSVVLSNSITRITRSVFSKCSSLTSITIPESVTNIGAYAFSDCLGLASVVIPENVTCIDRNAFSSCIGLKNITIPNSVTSIEEEAFSGCTGLVSIVIPDGVTNLGRRVLSGCDNLTSITISNKEVLRKNAVFSGCTGLTSLILPEGITSIGYEAFSGCTGLKNIAIPDGVTDIGTHAFSDCTGLTNVEIPEGVTTIGSCAFAGCTNLTDIVIPNSVTSIEGRAFSHCASLKSITIPDSVTSLGEMAFSNCESLESITIPKSVIKINDRVFSGMTRMKCIEVSEDNETYHADGNCLIETQTKTLLAGFENSIIPNDGSVTIIGYGAFSECKNLQSIVIPDSITTIGGRAFSDCTGLESVTISKSVTSIGFSAFSGCSGLKGLTIPNSVTIIEEQAFSDCTGLRDIVIPESVTKIEKNAFKGCTGLRHVKIPSSLNSIGYSAFPYPIKEAEFSSIESLARLPFRSEIPEKIADSIIVDGQILDKIVISGSTPYSKVLVSVLNSVNGMKAVLDDDSLASGEKLPSDYIEFLNPKEMQLAYLLVFQDGAKWNSYLNRVISQDKANRILKHCITILNSQKKISAKSAQAVSDIALSFSDTIDQDVLSELSAVLASLGHKDSEIEMLVKEREEPRDENDSALNRNKLNTILREYNKFSEEYQTALPLVKHGFRIKNSNLTCSKMIVAIMLAEYIKIWNQEQSTEHGYMSNISVLRSLSPTAFSPICDQIVQEIEKEDYIAFLKEGIEGKNYRYYIIPFCIYAGEKDISWFIAKINSDSKGRAQSKYKAGSSETALLLSETKAAALYFDKNDRLYQYAKRRGMNEETIRQKYIYNLDFDANGEKQYDLGNKTVTVRLNNDLSLSVIDGEKAYKSIPKKGSDAEKYEAANADFSDKKSVVKKIVKSACDNLFAVFLADKTYKRDIWVEMYYANPVIRQVAMLVVWEQNKKTFIVTEHGLVDVDGQPYELGDHAIHTAHPMKMSKDELLSWQKYFISQNLKQPFEQVWEPVINFNKVKDDRYTGCEIPLYRFNKQEKHGISLDTSSEYNHRAGEYHYDYIGITLKGCSLKWEPAEGTVYDMNMQSMIRVLGFHCDKQTRATNHIISYLDKCTVYGRIANDDVSVIEGLDGYTVAQIDAFLKFAIEKGSTSCTAAFLSFKNDHFAEFAEVDEFTLDF